MQRLYFDLFNYFIYFVMDFHIFFYKKNSAGGGKTAPTVLYLREKISVPRPRKPLNPRPIRTQGDVTPGCGPISLPVLWPGASEGIFFNHSLKFAPTEIRTQDLWSAARVS